MAKGKPPLFAVDPEERFVGAGDLDESRGSSGLDLGGRAEHFVRMVLRREAAVGGDDHGPRRRSLDAEDQEELRRLTLIAGVERR